MPVSCWMTQLGVVDDVRHQFTLLNDYANVTVNAAIEAAGDLLSYQVPNLSFTVTFPSLDDFVPVRPEDIPEFNTVGLPNLPDIPTAPDGDIPSAIVRPAGPPTAPPEAPTPNIPSLPLIYDPSFTAPPTLVFPDVPVFGDLTQSIELPVLLPITLPTPPVIDISSILFEGVRPTFDAIPPDAANFSYVESAYTELLVTNLKVKIQSMLDGESGLPAAVENAIWERAGEREDETSMRAEQDALKAHAAKGWALPSGVLDAQIQMVRQNSQNQRNALSRDTMIRTHEVLIEQLKFAVAQGIALEDLWIRLFTDIQNRRLQAARIAVDIAIAVFNARVGQFEAEATMYRVDAEVFKARLEAELAKLQVYSEQIKAQQLIGELNEQALRIYLARLQAVDTDVKIFIGMNEARKTTIEAELAKLTAFKVTIEVELAKLQASELRLKAWTGQLEGERLVQEAYKTRGQGYLTAVQAWQTEYQADIERFKGELSLLDSQTERFTATINAYSAFANYEQARAQIAVSDNAARIQQFTAEMGGLTSYHAAMIERAKMLNAGYSAQTEQALKNGEINIVNGMTAQQLMVRARETGAQVLSTLGSGAMSAANVNASISDSTNASGSCSTSINTFIE